LVKDQKRWRLLRDFKKGKFCFLIGVDNWSIELQKSEFYSLYLLLLKITEQLLVIKDELMDEESITLELEQLPWYIHLEGKKNEWSLRFVFESQDQTRSFEMYWPIPIAQNLFYEIKNKWKSMDLKINKNANFKKYFPLQKKIFHIFSTVFFKKISDYLKHVENF